MRNNVYELVKTFTDVAYVRNGTHAYAAGYYASMVSAMIDEMRIRGTRDMNDMANYYERLLATSINNVMTESK